MDSGLGAFFSDISFVRLRNLIVLEIYRALGSKLFTRYMKLKVRGNLERVCLAGALFDSTPLC